MSKIKNTLFPDAKSLGNADLFFLIAQVKRSIMLKMADACSQEANEHKQTRFHEMYVQRHNSVRYFEATFYVEICSLKKNFFFFFMTPASCTQTS